VNDRSVDDRLDALLQTIRTWDWRSGRGEARAPTADVATAIAGTPTTMAPVETGQNTDSTNPDPSPDAVAGPLATAVPNRAGESPDPLVTDRTTSFDPRPAATETPPHVAVTAPVEERSSSEVSSTQFEQDASATWSDLDEAPAHEPEQFEHHFGTQPVMVAPVRGAGTIPEEPVHHGSEDAAAAWFDDVVDLKPEPHAIRHLWSRRWVRIVTVCLAVAVPIVLIIGAIRVTTNSSPSAPPATTAGHASNTSSSSSSHHRSPHVAPIDSAQLTQYKTYAESLQKANVSADQGFVNAGSTPTQAVLAPVVASYLSALDLYGLRVHSMQWPASLQTDVTIDEAQLKTLTDLLVFLPAANPATLNVWLSQLHHDASIVQDTDNQVRHDLGLPALSSFPT
jgi:hypothetical protein